MYRARLQSLLGCLKLKLEKKVSWQVLLKTVQQKHLVIVVLKERNHPDFKRVSEPSLHPPSYKWPKSGPGFCAEMNWRWGHSPEFCLWLSRTGCPNASVCSGTTGVPACDNTASGASFHLLSVWCKASVQTQLSVTDSSIAVWEIEAESNPWDSCWSDKCADFLW